MVRLGMLVCRAASDGPCLSARATASVFCSSVYRMVTTLGYWLMSDSERLRAIEETVDTLDEGMQRIFTSLDGPLRVDVSGTEYRERKLGMVSQIEVNGGRLASIEKKIKNGIPTKLSKPVSAAIVTASGVVIAAALPSILDWIRSLS